MAVSGGQSKEVRVSAHFSHLRWAVLLVIISGLLVWAALQWLLPERADSGIIPGNGSVEGTEITVSSTIAGRLSSLNVDDGSRVRRGMVLATIDSDELRARLHQAQSLVAAAEAQVNQAGEAVDELRAQQQEARIGVVFAAASTAAAIAQAQASAAESLHAQHAAQAAYIRAKEEYARAGMLFGSGDIARAQYDAARAAYEAALAERDGSRLTVQRAGAAADEADAQRYAVLQRREDIAAVKARIERGESQVAAAQAQYESALAGVQEVRALLRDTQLIAPGDGTVLRVISQNGEVVAAGTPVVTFIDTSKLYVRVFLSEIDAGRLRVGEPAAISVDAFPGRSFPGTIRQIDESAQFTPKTVHMADERTRLVYGVKIALSNTGGYLKPGMVADARIAVNREDAKQ